MKINSSLLIAALWSLPFLLQAQANTAPARTGQPAAWNLETAKDSITSKSAQDDSPFGSTGFRLGFQGGWSYLTNISDVPDNREDYFSKLRSGYHFGLDMSYFLNTYFGVGLHYNFFSTQSEADETALWNPQTGAVATGNLEDKINANYIGPVVYGRLPMMTDRLWLLGHASAGYYSYRNDATIIEPITLKSNSLGIMGGLGADYRILENMALNLSASYMYVQLDEITFRQGVEEVTFTTDSDQDQLSRVDVSLGLRWWF